MLPVFSMDGQPIHLKLTINRAYTLKLQDYQIVPPQYSFNIQSVKLVGRRLQILTIKRKNLKELWNAFLIHDFHMQNRILNLSISIPWLKKKRVHINEHDFTWTCKEKGVGNFTCFYCHGIPNSCKDGNWLRITNELPSSVINWKKKFQELLIWDVPKESGTLNLTEGVYCYGLFYIHFATHPCIKMSTWSFVATNFLSPVFQT